MALITLLLWRDIPAQIVVKDGRRTVRHPLSARFQAAIDRAAMRDGAHGPDAYLAGWRRADPESAEGEPEALARDAAERIEQDYDTARLAELIAAGGRRAA